MSSRKTSKGLWLWPLVSIAMLIGIVAEAGTHIRPDDPRILAYQAASRKAIDAIPLTLVGPTGNIWTGSDTPVAAAATELLRPNTILSRDYVRQDDNGIVATLLIVDCNDARDLQGHYPPRCYPAQGEKTEGSRQRTWHLKGMDINGMEYEFARGDLGDEQVVYNFFITPHVPGGVSVSHKELDGVICRDMDDVYTAGEDYQRRYCGAA
ncbi:MAG: exosortase-associated EpsI family protein, partial [Tepidisphaeraceae bacterium]